MAKHRRRAVKKTAIAGVAVASAVSLGAVASPGMPGAMDQAVTMQQVRELKTQIDLMATSNLVNIVGAPSWLTGMLGGAGEGSVFMAGDTSASDIYNLLNTTDPNPIKGIGVNGGVSTDPTWVQWVSGVGAPKPVPYLEGQHQELTDEYKAVYDPAYNGVVGTALDEAKAEAWQNAYNASYDPVYNALTSGTAYQSVYNVALTGYKADYLNDLYKPQYAMGMPKYNDAYNPAYDSTYKTSSKYCFGNSTCLRLAREAAEAAGDLAVAGALANAIANPSAADDAAADAYAGPKAKADADATIADAVVNADKVAKLAGDAAAALVTPDDAMDAAGKAAGEAAVAEANANLPADQQIQQWKWVDDWGIKYVVDYKTSGAWVTPAMFDELPNAAKIAYAAAVISNGDLSAWRRSLTGPFTCRTRISSAGMTAISPLVRATASTSKPSRTGLSLRAKRRQDPGALISATWSSRARTALSTWALTSAISGTRSRRLSPREKESVIRIRGISRRGTPRGQSRVASLTSLSSPW